MPATIENQKFRDNNAYPPGICDICKKPFIPRTKRQKRCSEPKLISGLSACQEIYIKRESSKAARESKQGECVWCCEIGKVYRAKKNSRLFFCLRCINVGNHKNATDTSSPKIKPHKEDKERNCLKCNKKTVGWLCPECKRQNESITAKVYKVIT